MQPNYIPAYFLTSTPTLDKSLAQNAKAMAKVDQTLAKASRKTDTGSHDIPRFRTAKRPGWNRGVNLIGRLPANRKGTVKMPE